MKFSKEKLKCGENIMFIFRNKEGKLSAGTKSAFSF